MRARSLLTSIALPALLTLAACDEDMATGSTPAAGAPVAATKEEPTIQKPVSSSGDYGAALSGAKRAGERTVDKIDQRQQELLKEIDKQLEDG